MKIKFCCNSGANHKSCNEGIIDITEEYDISEDEWKEMSEKQKNQIVIDWAWENGLDIFYEEITP